MQARGTPGGSAVPASFSADCANDLAVLSCVEPGPAASMRNMRSVEHARSVGLMAATALCWSLGGLLIKSVAWPPLAVAGGRGLIAAAFLAVFAPRFRFTWSAAQIGGAVAYAATTILFVTANKLTTAANAILLQYTAPVWIALFGAWFLGERATRADWLTIVVVFGGMGLFFCDDLQFAGFAGNLVALASGVAFASMTLLLRKQKGTSAVESIFLGNLLAGVIGLPFIVQSGLLPNPASWVALGLLGTVQLGVSYLLYARAIRHVTALEAVLIPVIEPILNPIWVLLALGERPGPLSLLGGVIVLAAVTARMIHSLRTTPVTSVPPPLAV
jgi:drug/metabolite transporter (DMT)-like permease